PARQVQVAEQRNDLLFSGGEMLKFNVRLFTSRLSSLDGDLVVSRVILKVLVSHILVARAAEANDAFFSLSQLLMEGHQFCEVVADYTRMHIVRYITLYVIDDSVEMMFVVGGKDGFWNPI